VKYTVIIENTVKYTVTLRGYSEIHYNLREYREIHCNHKEYSEIHNNLRKYSEIHQDPRNTEKNMKTLREYREYCESLEVPHENTLTHPLRARARGCNSASPKQSKHDYENSTAVKVMH